MAAFRGNDRGLWRPNITGGPDEALPFTASAILALALLAAPLAIGAQPAGKVARIGILSPSPAYSGRVEASRQGLQALGYVEGRNIAIEHRDAMTEAELPVLAAELVRLGVDVIVTGGSASIPPAVLARADEVIQ